MQNFKSYFRAAGKNVRFFTKGLHVINMRIKVEEALV